MRTDGKVDILSGLKYHGYVVLIAHIDADRFSIKNGIGNDGDPLFHFTEPNKLFREHCSKTRQHLDDTLKEFKNWAAKPTNIAEEKFNDFLYNPACFVAFGDNDNIAILALDEFEHAARLSSLVDVPVRQTCLAFCPELKSLGLRAKKYKGIFCELDDIYLDPHLAINQLENPDAIASCEYFLAKRPLLAVTYFKLNGMTVLGPGLMTQEFSYKVMAERIRETREELLKKVENSPDSILYSDKDIESFRCVFLDPQGWSDIATLMFCTNYSVIITMVAALQFLTVGDLYQRSNIETAAGTKGVSLTDAVKCFKVHEDVAKLGGKEAEQFLSANHVFCSTYTSVGIYKEAFKKEVVPAEGQNYHYKGVVIADTNLSVCAGHVLNTRKQAEHVQQLSEKPKDISHKLNGDYLWYMVGHNDYVYQQLAEKKRDVAKAVELEYLVKQIKAIQRSSGKTNKRDCENLAMDIQDICTDLRIPIPFLRHVMKEVDYDRHVEIRIVLEKLRKSLFEDKEGYLNLKKLANYIHIARVPAPLSSAIQFLYTDFANYLSDSFLFESVLDLYDIFIALRSLLVEELPALLKKELVQELKSSLVHHDILICG